MNTGKLAIGAALTLAVVMVSSSTTVLAMTVLPKGSVGHSQLQTGAVTTQKIHKHAVTRSQVQRGTFVESPQLRFGKGYETSVPATTVLKIPRVNVVVKTDGTAGGESQVVVRIPRQPTMVWIMQVDDGSTSGTRGGALLVNAPGPANSLSATFWRTDNSQKFYLHCNFDQTFIPKGPLSCWAISN